MEMMNNREYEANDREFIMGNNQNQQMQNNEGIHDGPSGIYDPALFQKKVLIEFFQNNGIFLKTVFCNKCHNICKLTKEKQAIDDYIWRCRGHNQNHDVKINIRTKSFLEGFHINIQILYFVIFHCFVEAKSLNDTLIETNEFAKTLNITSISKISLSKLYGLLRNKIKEKTHLKWSNSFLGEKIGENGYASIEIDESKIIGNNEDVFWIFGMISRETKDARIFCVMNNRTTNNLLPIVKNNVLASLNEEESVPQENSVKTRIYSDCYSAYQIDDFKNLGYILKRVNHSVWFGYGLFHTNTIEGLWSKIKKYSGDFSGISIDNLKKNFNNNPDLIKSYLDGWITFSLLIREFKRRKLSWPQRIKLLCECLNID